MQKFGNEGFGMAITVPRVKLRRPDNIYELRDVLHCTIVLFRGQLHICSLN